MERADSIYKRHSQLAKSEQAMEGRFEETKKKLEDYRDQFFKTRKTLQQDHDSFVKIREKEARELEEQVALQKEVEVQTMEALQQKADLNLNVNSTESMDAASRLVNSSDPISRRTGQLVQAQQEVTAAIREEAQRAKKIREQEAELEAKQNKEKADKEAAEQKAKLEK